METLLLNGRWEAEDDPTPRSADNSKPTSRSYDGRHTYFGFTSAFVSVEERPRHVGCQKTCAKPRRLKRRTERRADLANKLAGFFNRITYEIRDEWVRVTTAWRFLRLRMEERPPMWRVAANILNKQSRTADKGWSSSLGVGRGVDNSSP
jgi:hypothetical protein